MLDHVIETCVPKHGNVLDLGCFGFAQVARASRLGRSDIHHAGVDSRPYLDLPAGFEFAQCDIDTDPLPFDTDRFDLVVASHVIEHLRNPVNFFGECLRVCKPRGYVYVEAPSERSLWLPGFPLAHEKFYSWSFFDDPTHVGRPWTPQALHRMAACYGAEVIETKHLTSNRARLKFPFLALRTWFTKNRKDLRLAEQLERTAWLALGWSCFLVARKREPGKPSFLYHIPER